MRSKTIYVVGHINPDTDSITSAISYAHFLCERHKHHIIAAAAGSLNPETKWVLRYWKTKKPMLLQDAKDKNVIIVDHNEIHQAVKNIRQANILEIIDHHRIGDVETIHPIPFENEPRGSTTSIIADRFSWFKVPISRKMAGLILSGILSDTILLNSPTTTRKDREWVRRLAKIAGVDYKKYGRKMLKEGCDLIRFSPNKILLTDFKTFAKGDKKAGVGQITVTSTIDALHKRHVLLNEMDRIRMKKNFKYVFLMITNIITLQTDLLISGDLDKVKKIFRKPINNNTIVLKNVVSRKKQVQPYVLKLI